MCPTEETTNQISKSGDYCWRPWEPKNANATGSQCTYTTKTLNFPPCIGTSTSFQITCDLCSTVFKRESELRRHKLSKHTIKRENCKVCYKIFTRKDNLARHMKLAHSGNYKPHCKYCSKPFSRKDAAERHELACSANPINKRDEKNEDHNNVSCSTLAVSTEVLSYPFRSHSERLRMKMMKSSSLKNYKEAHLNIITPFDAIERFQ